VGIVVDFVDVILGVFDVRTVLIAGTIFIPLERLRPLHRGQRLVREGWRTDLIFDFRNNSRGEIQHHDRGQSQNERCMGGEW